MNKHQHLPKGTVGITKGWCIGSPYHPFNTPKGRSRQVFHDSCDCWPKGYHCLQPLKAIGKAGNSVGSDSWKVNDHVPNKNWGTDFTALPSGFAASFFTKGPEPFPETGAWPSFWRRTVRFK